MKQKILIQLSLVFMVCILSGLWMSKTLAQDPVDPLTDLHQFDVIEDLDWHTLPSNRAPTYQMRAADSDGDGLDDANEQMLGTDPLDVDSDCDYIDDGTEVGNIAAPTDTDSDGLIDALESNVTDSDQDSNKDHNDPTTGPQSSCARFTPFAIANDDTSSTTLEVRIMGGSNVTAVAIQLNQFSFVYPKLDGIQTSEQQIIQLYDDGSHGDRVAGDNIWTRHQFTSDASLSADEWRTVEFSIIQVTANGNPVEIDRRTVTGSSFGDVPLGIVHTDALQTPTMLNAEVQYTSHLINLIHPIRSLEVKGSNNLHDVSQQFYQYFPDNFDFLIFFPEAPAVDGAPFGRFFMVQNDIQNIGGSIFDSTDFYGSNGQLQGAIFMNFGTNGPTLHEISHRWAARGLSGLGFHQCAGGHWGPVGVGEGQLGGFNNASLVNNGNGTYTVDSFGSIANGGDSVSYVPLELYLGGFIDAASVPNISVPVNVDCGSFDYSVSGKVTFAADSLNTVSITDIQNELGGPRIPDFTTSQKAFATAMIVASQQKLTPAEMAFFNNWSERFGNEIGDGFIKSFQEGTGNIATMDTRIMINQQNNPPHQPHTPIPADGATNVPTNQTLNWQGGDPNGGVVTYTIAFGTVNPPPEVATTTQASYVPSLVTNTHYYWRITATDGLSTTLGPTWQFTTAAVAVGEYKIYLPLLLK